MNAWKSFPKAATSPFAAGLGREGKFDSQSIEFPAGSGPVVFSFCGKRKTQLVGKAKRQPTVFLTNLLFTCFSSLQVCIRRKPQKNHATSVDLGNFSIHENIRFGGRPVDTVIHLQEYPNYRGSLPLPFIGGKVFRDDHKYGSYRVSTTCLTLRSFSRPYLQSSTQSANTFLPLSRKRT